MKSILITGCSSGIGLDCARTLHQKGWQVFASCRAQADCDRLIAEGIASPRLDLADPKSISQAFNEVLEETGGTLDALYNNGAFAIPGAVEDLPTDGLRATFETNFFGYHDLTRQAIKVMRAQGHGHIINCSSVLGLVAMRYRGAYNSTKFALEGLTDTLRLEMAGSGIHIVLIEPGPITTNIRQNAQKPFETWIDWENSARTDEYHGLRKRLYADYSKDVFELPSSAVTSKILKALNSNNPRPRYRVTTATHLMVYLKRLLPTRWMDKIAGRV